MNTENYNDYITTGDQLKPDLSASEDQNGAKKGGEELLSMDEAFLKRLESAIQEHIEDKDFGVDELGREIGMSRSQIHRKLQALTGKSASRYIRTFKLQRAKELLEKNVGTVSEISFRMGFSSPAYFGQVFLEEYGYPPSEVRKSGAGETPSEAPEQGVRKLAAILFSDIEGYSALMGRDEQKALEVLNVNRSIQKTLFEQHNGRFLKEIGDGMLAQFDSALDSVACALEIQREAREKLEGKVRIGIHLGDVTVTGDDVFGDGVNIASRLEAVADPGGIYISESVQRAIRGRSEIQVRKLGDVQLKNIDFLVSTYCLVGDGLPLPPPDKLQELIVASPVEVKKGVFVAHANDGLIREVFDSLVAVKPSLEKFLLIDEDDDEEVDIRLLADQIIRNYPWVISIELRRLFSGTMRTLDRSRLDQIYKSIERSLQFLSYVMVVELYEEIDRKQVKLDPGIIEELNQRFENLAFHDFVWLIRTIGGVFENVKKELFLPEMSDVLSSGFYDSLDFELPSRTERGHYEIDLPDEEIERQCIEYIDKLSFILTKLAFIAKYRLVTVKEIKVLKRRHKNALFEHWIDILNSFDSDFSSKEEVFETFSDSNAVLLMKSLKRPSDFLNLSPLIIDTRTEVIDSKEKFNLKKDIFIYTRSEGDKIFYAGTEVKEKSDLSYLGNYEDLVADFKDLLSMRPNNEKEGGSK